MPTQPLVLTFKQIDKHDLPLVGGKGANLGEMTQAGFPVPPGFAVTVEAYDLFLRENNLDSRINEILKVLDCNDPDNLKSNSDRIQKLILHSKIPDEVVSEVTKYYKSMSKGLGSELVAVRSSATAEDLPNASFAGQQSTFLNVKGDANVLESIKSCWSSLYTARACFYREQNKIAHQKVKISVSVQKMIQSEVAGVMFTINPINDDTDTMVLEAVWGLGEYIVGGQVIPDRYLVQKETFAILSKEISDQDKMLAKKGIDNIEMHVPKKLIGKQKISDKQIVELARIGQKIQEHYYFPQDIEWHLEKGKLYIVQSRPITTIDHKIDKTKRVTLSSAEGSQADTPILTGDPASPGIGTGHVKILKSFKEISVVKSGDILVTDMTSPDFVPAMKRASAIVTNKGGLTSHAAIVSRELGIPCVVGTKNATSVLKQDMVVTVDGAKGLIFKGGTASFLRRQESRSIEPSHEKTRHIKTATKLYVNLGEPERANEISKMNVDGVGLLRAEFMIAAIGIHPKEAIKNKKQDLFINKLADHLEVFCKAFEPRPIIYRATDFKTNEYRSLEGGERWEPEEPNPMLGFRGAFRYVASPEVFNLELLAIKKVREKYHNLHLMIPFVRSPQELIKVKRIIASQDLTESATFKLWMMVELPVNVIKLQDFIDVGIDGVSVGSNDLTMLMMGTDRDNSEVASSFDERAPVIDWALKRVIKICHKNGITSSICGQAPSTYEDLVERLVRYGITSISVNPDAINRVRQVIATAEKELIK
jgi:pyruvate,water dikinase